MAIHTVNPGDKIKADDINQFVEIYQQNPTGNVFGTNRGVLLQSGNAVGISESDNIYFKQVFETVYGGEPRVVVALGDSYDQARGILGVDDIYSVTSGDAMQLSDHNWYGYVDQEEVNLSVEGSSGFAMTNISAFDDYIYGYDVTAEKDGEAVKAFVFSTLNEENTKEELTGAGLNYVNVTGARKLAVKSRHAIQNIITYEPYRPDYKQFDLRGVVDTREITEGGKLKKQYKWNAQWYSHFDGEEQSQCYGVYFNDKEIRPKDMHNVGEGWTSISASDEWADSVSVDLDVYLNVKIDLIRCKLKEESPDEWEYNDSLTWWNVDLSALSSTGWYRRGSVKSNDGEKQYSDGYLVETSYKIGNIKITNENVRIEQIFDGTQTYIAPFYEELSSVSGDVVYDVPDSEIREVGLSSLERNLCVLTSMVSSEVSGHVVWDEISTKYECWSMFDFGKPEIQTYGNIRLSSEDDNNVKRQFVIREHDEGSGTSTVRYAEISGIPCNLSGDANTGTGLSSIRRFNGSNGDYLGLYNFEQPDQDFTLGIDFGKKHLDSKYKILVRDDQTKTLRYADLSVDISGSVDISALSSAISAMSSDISAVSSDIADISANMKADSEVPAIELSSVQRYSYVDENQQPRKAYMLYHFDNPDDLLLNYSDLSNENNSRYKILVRDDEEGQLKYANLSLDLSASVISGDANATQDRKSIDLVHEDGDFLQLYHFDNPDDLLLTYSDLSDENDSRYKILVRDDEEGQLKYANLSLDISVSAVAVSGDANATQDRKSIELVNEDSNFLQLYGFDQDNGNTFGLIVPNYYDYYYSGAQAMSHEDGESGPELVVREKTSADREIDYQQLSVQIPPFVHGDADSYPETNRKSIDSITFAGRPDKSYYQLHNFNSPDSIPKHTDLLSDDYVNLANGMKEGSDDNDLVLIRNKDGNLSYRKLYIKGSDSEAGLITRLEILENSVGGMGEEISAVESDVSHLSANVRGVIDNMWIRGSNNQINYGSSIGNSGKTKTIDLDNRRLETGTWNITAGGLTTEGGVSCKGLGVQGVANLEDQVYVYGSISINEDVECANIDAYGNVNVLDGGVLKIGNTTLNETQLQQLLALIS